MSEKAKDLIEKAMKDGSVKVQGEFDLMRGDYMIAEARTWGEIDENGNAIDVVAKYGLTENSIYLWGDGVCEAVDSKDLAKHFDLEA